MTQNTEPDLITLIKSMGQNLKDLSEKSASIGYEKTTFNFNSENQDPENIFEGFNYNILRLKNEMREKEEYDETIHIGGINDAYTVIQNKIGSAVSDIGYAVDKYDKGMSARMGAIENIKHAIDELEIVVEKIGGFAPSLKELCDADDDQIKEYISNIEQYAESIEEYLNHLISELAEFYDQNAS